MLWWPKWKLYNYTTHHKSTKWLSASYVVFLDGCQLIYETYHKLQIIWVKKDLSEQSKHSFLKVIKEFAVSLFKSQSENYKSPQRMFSGLERDLWNWAWRNLFCNLANQQHYLNLYFGSSFCFGVCPSIIKCSVQAYNVSKCFDIIKVVAPTVKTQAKG